MNAITPAMGYTRWWITDYARRPLNVALAVIVPLLLVTLTAGTLAKFASLLGSSASSDSAVVATAGWAAAILAGVGGFFQVSGCRIADRRLAAAGGRAMSVAISRLLSTGVVGAVAVVGALLALRARTPLAFSPEIVASTALFAVIYLGLGVVVGALVNSELQGSLVIVFLWFFDVFFGPAMGSDRSPLRVLPLHYPTTLVMAQGAGNSGSRMDLGISLAWAIAAVAAAVLALVSTTRRHVSARRLSNRRVRRVAAGSLAAFREVRRVPALWVLVAGLPVLFISAASAVTPADPTPVQLRDAGRTTVHTLLMSDVHGAVMVPITIAVLASLVGLFVVLEAAQADRRLGLSGFRPSEVLSARLAAVLAATLLATGVAIAVTALSFTPKNWPVFIGANVLVGITYALIGLIVGPVLGRLGGLYVLLVLPFLDIGVAQNAMFSAVPPAWARFLPGHGAVRMMIDGAFTPTFDQPGALAIALAWLVALGLIATLTFRKLTSRARAS